MDLLAAKVQAQQQQPQDFYSPVFNPQSLASPTQPTTSDDVAVWVQNLLWKARMDRAPLDTQWGYYFKLYKSQQWPNRKSNRGTEWRAFLSVNYIFSIIESIQAILMDNDPHVNLSPGDPAQYPYAHTLQAGIDSVFRRRKIKMHVSSAEKNALIYGTGYVKVWWNKELEQGKGDIDCKVIPTECIYPDMEGTDFDDAEYVLEVRPTPLSVVRRKWPDKANLVHPDSLTGSTSRKERRDGSETGSFDPITPFQWVSPVYDNPLVADQTEFSSPPYRKQSNKEDTVNVIECWVKDYTMETVQTTFMQATPFGPVPVIREYQRPKYPYGRLIHVANGVTLDDQPSPYTRWPYVRFVDVDLPGEFFGMGEPEILKDLQHELNKRRSQMIDNAAIMGNSIWIIDRDSVVDEDELNNKPGLIVRKAAGREVRREGPPQIPAWQSQMVELTIRDMREISGIGAIPAGIPPKGVRSGSGFEAAQNIATTRIRRKADNLELSLEDLGRIIISLIQRFYTTPRLIRIQGNAGNTVFVPYDGRNVRGDWDIKVEAGSTMATTQAARAQQAIQLYQLQAIDKLALLQNVSFPNYEEVLRRMGQYVPPFMQYPGFPGASDRDRQYSGYAQAIQNGPPPGGAAPPPNAPGGGPQPGGGGPPPSGPPPGGPGGPPGPH